MVKDLLALEVLEIRTFKCTFVINCSNPYFLRLLISSFLASDLMTDIKHLIMLTAL